MIGALGVVTAAYFVVCLAAALQFRAAAFPGFFTNQMNIITGGEPSSEVQWTGLAAGLRRGDRILAINGTELAVPSGAGGQPLRQILQALNPGDAIEVSFERNVANAAADPALCDAPTGNISRCRISYSTMLFPAGDFLAYFIVPFVTGVLSFLIGALTLYYRNRRSDGLTVSAASFLAAVFMGGVFEVGSTGISTPFWLMMACALGGTLLSLGFTFPVRLRVMWRYGWVAILPLAGALVMGLLLAASHMNPASPQDSNQVQLASLFAFGCLLVTSALYLAFQRPRAVTTALRRQADLVLIGCALAILPGLVWVVYTYLIPDNLAGVSIGFESLMPLFFFPVASFSVALLQFRRLDTDRIISQSITYAILLLALLLGTFLLSLGGALIFIDLFNASGVLSISLILFAMVMLFTPIRLRLQDRIDNMYYRTRRNFQEKVETFSQTLVSTNVHSEVVSEYRRLVDENMAPSAIFVFVRARETGDYGAFNHDTEVRFAADSPLVNLLRDSREAFVLNRGAALPVVLLPEQSRLRVLRAHAIAPMRGSDDLIGFVVVSDPRANKPSYDYEEIRFFSLMTNQLAVGTERVQVIGSLEQRVRELDVLSQVGQAVNFTIEFDDLLELINAQTSKLVDAPYFYIALYDESVSQLYFAFFLEGDDRDASKENVRFPLDGGLFSEVVRTSQPIRVDNYVFEMDKRGQEIKFETRSLRAWMGVPLSAGRRNLGVLAVGKSRSGDNFTDEQFKIFSDIGALAATSIDKARLFAETRSRERQLTVLNDISRQLVATESDVEKLLQIIMTSAVEILNCEAGSLLLTAEDDDTQLEFRVVIGGAESLLGTRIDARKGIAGQVVKTGKYSINNDTASSKANQQVTDTYKTQSLLAVPLIAKNNVIGVLEVLNKKDGSGFVQEDAELMTTFAGQAAVAIENARLFRMTDLQLAQRVRELEALERIDNDLNRALEVSEVATITVRSAMQVLNAQAGALGIVYLDEHPPFLDIVGIEGYTEEEYPKGANGLRWSLETGIISRVMRSKQPDIAVDISIDPNYAGGLKGSLSQITLPIFSGNDINAILILEKNQMPRFTLSDWAFAQRLAEHASIAIANAQLYAALTQANKSKSEFMGFAAHELKNPLTSVIGFADLMRQGMTGELNDQQQSLINIIHSNANRMQTIIQDLRDSARMDANEFSVELAPMNIRHAVIETLRPFVQFMRDKNQELINQVPDDLPLIMGDENRLIQVLTNLVSNAHKYSPADTSITIRARVVENYVDRDGRKRGAMMEISVADQGLGISKEDQQRLFRERYFRSTNRIALEQPGTGLGMTLTYGIVQKHNGEIWVESELGQGSTFYVAIPLAPQEVQTRVGEAGD
jgi:signal transduction histidine kinase/multidrug transporter EmrE-like cation transporter